MTTEVAVIGRWLSGPAALALVVSAALAATPVDNLSDHRHPNLVAAQRLATQAYERISAAQRANEFDMVVI